MTLTSYPSMILDKASSLIIVPMAASELNQEGEYEGDMIKVCNVNVLLT